MSAGCELTDFQILTPGLHSGDNIKIRINFRLVASNFWRYFPWAWRIQGFLDGQTVTLYGGDIGTHGGKDNCEMVFTGKMPSGKALRGKLVFGVKFFNFLWTVIPPLGWKNYIYTQFAERPLTIPNLDTGVVPTPPQPIPAICTTGQTKCVGYDQYICRSGAWIINEYNSNACGYVIAPICKEGETRCIGTDLQKCINNSWRLTKKNATECGYVVPPPPSPTPPPPTEPGWFERNKKTIIIISVVVLAVAIIALLFKKKTLGVRSPVTGVRSPIYRPPRK